MRPLKFKSSKEVKEKIDKWLEECKEEGRPLTITGLALALDTSRQTLLEYEGEVEDKEKKQLSEEENKKIIDTIKKAKQMCENYAEAYLYSGRNVTGAIFNLKNNYNWKDKTETDITSGGQEIKSINYIVPDGTNNKTNDKTA